ncbi:nucleoside-triphosphatase THEP1 [Drosophila grimshawi]|uniref:GH14943 n=1 Tax=Drosophila grimshawi TaxID=7222 RepID=B4J1L3_DROGR|nr:nucleoside-triphosphatase THEP1 [Drosophila grimshawi]EDV96933.1 GH14943 [Drosophila grimshawi]
MEKYKVTTFLITGQPGVGKTTLVRKIIAKLGGDNKLAGFYTEEVRTNGQRIGFDVVTVSGTRGILARENPLDNQRRPKVGKYAVYVQDFENVTLPLLQLAPHSQQLLIIDEIGKMELLSHRFESAINELMRQKQLILATIPSQTRQPMPIVERLRNAPDSFIYQVTKANRDALTDDITEHVRKTLFMRKNIFPFTCIKPSKHTLSSSSLGPSQE